MSQEATAVLDVPGLEEGVGCDEKASAAPVNTMSKHGITTERENAPVLKRSSNEKPPSFRRAFLRRLTSNIESVVSMLEQRGGSEVRGIELFRHKARLVIALQKHSIQGALRPWEADIF